MVCLKCGSDRTVLVDKGRKVKCLDCHKTINKDANKLPIGKGDANAVISIMRRITAGMYLSRDRLEDVKEFVDSDFVEEDTNER